MTIQKPVILCVLDGWGAPDATHDAIAYANTVPILNNLLNTCPHSLLQASGLDVGLPEGQMGNSEVGHLNLGAGRVVMQDLPRIDLSIANREFEKLPELLNFIGKKPKICHLIGLFSDGGVHSHINHLIALCEILDKRQITCYVHAFLDGRDTPPQSAINYVSQFERHFKDSSFVKLASLCGRYYAMDRDERWDRTEKAYNMLTQGKGAVATDWHQAINASYANGVEDEFILPLVAPFFKGIQSDDGLISFNFRADRIRQILRALIKPDFKGFPRLNGLHMGPRLAMVDYASDLQPYISCLFPPQDLKRSLGALLSAHAMKQFRIAETEKYPHVTFFFNGGQESAFPGETRCLIPSPKVATYDLQPEMSAPLVSEKLCEAVKSGQYDFILVNFANADMVGHTGNEDASKLAMQAIDKVIGELVAATCEVGGLLCITADHGNIETLYDETTGQKHTAHTTNPVPFLLVNAPSHVTQLRPGRLADVAPTLLPFLGLPQPPEMTGHSLIQVLE